MHSDTYPQRASFGVIELKVGGTL